MVLFFEASRAVLLIQSLSQSVDIAYTLKRLCRPCWALLPPPHSPQFHLKPPAVADLEQLSPVQVQWDLVLATGGDLCDVAGEVA